ncbi:MAG: hypothetical protein H0V34_04440 [Gammaproteobacteria bacterium]|nr:hypothetical protein [Gammaproteobacteria bacterium]
MDRGADYSLSNTHRKWTAALCILLLCLALSAPNEPASAQHTNLAAGANPFDALGKLFGGGQPEFLPADEAFKLNVTTRNASSLLASWQIAQGYYLYRDKLRFSLRGNGVRLGSAEFPAGEMEEDEYFGRVEIYTRELLEITLPLRRDTTAARTITLNVRYQGCAEAGICCPPIDKQVRLRVPAAAPNGDADATFSNPPGTHSRVIARHGLGRAALTAASRLARP